MKNDKHSGTMEKAKKTIVWITGSNFIDVDIPIVPRLAMDYDIRWFFLRQKESWYGEEDCKSLLDKSKIKGSVISFTGRLRDVSTLMIIRRLVADIKRIDADLYYINYIGIPYLWPCVLMSGIKKKRIVYPCHDFVDHVGVQRRKMYVLTKKMIFGSVNNFQFFSRTQQNLFMKAYPRRITFYAPLALKDYGPMPAVNLPDDRFVFLFFGNIRENKGAHLLIDAGNKLYEKYPGKFTIVFAGNCSKWNYYDSMIKHRECFSLDIRRIENEEIPNLFARSHFLVLPYEDVTQSGPLLIAYNYGLPVIASNHDGFKEYIENGKNGLLFKNLDSDDLFRTMEGILTGNVDYLKIKKNLSYYIDENCAVDSIILKYKEGLDGILNKQR